MKDQLKVLVGKDLVFIDEHHNILSGILMESCSSLYSKGGVDYFFVPCEINIKPFKVPYIGLQRVRVSKKAMEIYGHSNNLNNLANGEN